MPIVGMVAFVRYNGTNVYPNPTLVTLALVARGPDVWRIDMATPFAGVFY